MPCHRSARSISKPVPVSGKSDAFEPDADGAQSDDARYVMSFRQKLRPGQERHPPRRLDRLTQEHLCPRSKSARIISKGATNGSNRHL